MLVDRKSVLFESHLRFWVSVSRHVFLQHNTKSVHVLTQVVSLVTAMAEARCRQTEVQLNGRLPLRVMVKALIDIESTFKSELNQRLKKADRRKASNTEILPESN